MKRVNQYIAVMSVLLLSLVACSDDQSGHHHNHDAHVHGLVQLNVAVDNTIVTIGVESPAANIVGFEHQATTDQEMKHVEQSQHILKQASKMFSFDDAKCEAQQVEVDFSGIATDGIHEDKHEHQHEHAHENHSEKASDSSHSDIKAHYVFSCDNASALKSIRVNLFDHFKNIENINVLWITQNGQGSKNLSTKNIKTKTIDLK